MRYEEEFINRNQIEMCTCNLIYECYTIRLKKDCSCISNCRWYFNVKNIDVDTERYIQYKMNDILILIDNFMCSDSFEYYLLFDTKRLMYVSFIKNLKDDSFDNVIKL